MENVCFKSLVKKSGTLVRDLCELVFVLAMSARNLRMRSGL